MKKHLILAISLVLTLCLTTNVFSQDCPTCFPYYFCPFPAGSDHPAIHCTGCPDLYAKNNGLTVYKPGLPKCINIENDFGPSLTVTGVLPPYSTFHTFDAGINNINISNAAAWANSQYGTLCPTIPESDCCLTIDLTTDAQIFISHGHKPDETSAFTGLYINKNDCTLACDEPTHVIKTYINFTSDFLYPGSGFWVDEDRSNLPIDLSDLDAQNFLLFNLSDINIT